MKILWVNANFLHPTTKGGQIRTLEMLRRLHRRHEVHYAAIEDQKAPEGMAKAGEYSTRAFPFRLDVVPKNSPRFVGQVVGGLFSSLPLAISRYYSREMERALAELMRREQYDKAVCDFLVSAVHFPRLERALLFQHNVETMIWRRHADHAGDALRRLYFKGQSNKMFAFEAQACRRAGHIAAVSEQDAETMRALFGVANVSAIPTGVDVDFFSPRSGAREDGDLVFVGSMDWLPNVDGVSWFVEEILPLIREKRPGCRVTVVGRTPPKKIVDLAANDKRVVVTGTVPDVRPYLWGARASIVPLRIGGGTRIKIYESMAARCPVVATTVGAEGLDVVHDQTVLLADRPQEFAEACLRLMEDEELRRRIASDGWELVRTRFSWDGVARRFEEVLDLTPGAS